MNYTVRTTEDFTLILDQRSCVYFRVSD